MSIRGGFCRTAFPHSQFSRVVHFAMHQLFSQLNRHKAHISQHLFPIIISKFQQQKHFIFIPSADHRRRGDFTIAHIFINFISAHTIFHLQRFRRARTFYDVSYFHCSMAEYCAVCSMVESLFKRP